MKSAKNKRRLTLLTLVVALGVAVYLNWEYAKNDSSLLLDTDAPVNASADQAISEALPDKNYGDAQLVSAGVSSADGYFEQARYNRTKTRDEALDKLQKSLEEADLTASEKETLTADVAATVAAITTENDIESLVKAKGFLDCVVFLDGEKVDVAVKTTDGAELTQESVAQVRDVVLSKVETEAKNITVVEVK